MRRAVLFARINVWEKYAVEMYGIMHNVRKNYAADLNVVSAERTGV